MFVEDLLRRFGNDNAIDNARAAATELAQRRVEREAVEIFLERHAEACREASGAPGVAVGDR